MCGERIRPDSVCPHIDALKEKAEYITTPILEDGVKNGLKHYNLI